MSLGGSQDDTMCTEEDIEKINSHTDEVGEKVHGDYRHLAERVDKLEEKFTEDIREIFDHLRDIRKSIFTSQWTAVGVTCSLIVVLFGALFGWLWSQDQFRSGQINQLFVMVGSAVATEKALVDSVKSIEKMVEDEVKENGEEHDEDLENHVKFYHGE